MNNGNNVAEEDTIQLSFLDVLSCGLGAAILLFLIFSAIGSPPTQSLSSPNYLMIEGKFDHSKAYMRLVVQPPSRQNTIFFCLGENPGYCGATLMDGTIVPRYEGNYLAMLSPVAENGQRFFNVQIFTPLPGEWKLNLRFDTEEERPMAFIQDPPQPIRVDMSISGRDVHPAEFSMEVDVNSMPDCTTTLGKNGKIGNSNQIFCGPFEGGHITDNPYNSWIYLKVKDDQKRSELVAKVENKT